MTNVAFLMDVQIGSQGTFVCKALNKYTKLKARCITYADNYVRHFKDLWLGQFIHSDGRVTMELSKEEFEKRADEAKAIIENADFFIFRRTYVFINWIKQSLTPYNHVMVLYGSEARLNPSYYFWLSEKENVTLVTSADYSYSSKCGFSCQHIPISLDLDIIPRRVKVSEKIRIAHAPTDRNKKATNILENAAKHLDAELVMIENKPWTECLKTKATCDINFDQMWLGSYGMSTVESFAMYQPSFAKVNHWVYSMYPDLPIVNVNELTLKKTLRRLIRNSNKIHELGIKGREFVEKHHSLKATAKRWYHLIRFVMEEKKCL